MEKTKLKGELKGLGKDLAAALGQISKSKEFKNLRKDVVHGIKSITKSLADSMRAANKSQSASQIKTRLNRIAKVGAAEGKVKAQQAQIAASVQIRKARAILKTMAKKFKNNGKKG